MIDLLVLAVIFSVCFSSAIYTYLQTRPVTALKKITIGWMVDWKMNSWVDKHRRELRWKSKDHKGLRNKVCKGSVTMRSCKGVPIGSRMRELC